MDLDRGYGHVAAQNRALDEDGIYTHSMMDSDRVGLPRRWIGFAATELGDCPAKCDHKEGAVGCRKYMFTCVHKGEVELTLWQDNKTIISYGNFHSSARAGELARGAHGDPESFAVWVPEGIFHYNVEGRSPTDGSDQQAKKLDISERRTQRVGIKGISFVLNRALTNAAIMKRFKQPSTIKRWRLDQEHSKARCLPPSACPSHRAALARLCPAPRHAARCSLCACTRAGDVPDAVHQRRATPRQAASPPPLCGHARRTRLPASRWRAAARPREYSTRAGRHGGGGIA